MEEFDGFSDAIIGSFKIRTKVSNNQDIDISIFQSGRSDNEIWDVLSEKISNKEFPLCDLPANRVEEWVESIKNLSPSEAFLSFIQETKKSKIIDGGIIANQNKGNKKKLPPPILIDLSQFFMPKDIREYALGDIYEKFESDIEKSGEQMAKLNLVKNILYSVCPFVWEFFRGKFDKLVGSIEK